MNLYLNAEVEVNSNCYNEYQIDCLALLKKYISNSYNTYSFVFMVQSIFIKYNNI